MIATDNDSLDVRLIEPKLKHPPIFTAFATDTTVGDMVRDNPLAASVFKRYRIDYCCQGKRQFEEACRTAGVAPTKLQGEIDAVAKQPNAHIRVENWPLDMLIDYIINNHHLYVRKAGNDIKKMLDKVSRIHGAGHPELLLISQYFLDLMEELESHMLHEEQVFFPAIKKLTKKNEARKQIKYGWIKNAVDIMEIAHEETGILMENIRTKTNDYELPADACTSNLLLFSMLKEFEHDLHQHIHLENNVLFPKAIVMEEQLVK